MNIKKLVITYTVFMIAFLFTPSGCYASAPGNETVRREPVAVDASSAAHDHPLVTNVLDAGGQAADVNTDLSDRPVLRLDRPRPIDITALTDAAHVVDSPVTPLEPQGFLLAPTSCHGRRLSLSSEVFALARDGFKLWHLCYKTPSTMTSNHVLARRRAVALNVNLVTEDGEQELVHSLAPTSANPWTTSVLIALPPNQVPSFSLMNLYEGDERLSAVNFGSDGRFPVVHGELQSWQVAVDGIQTAASARYGCYDRLHPEGRPMFFLPAGVCPMLEDSCPALAPMSCRPF